MAIFTVRGLTTPRRKRVPLTGAGTGFTSVPDGHTEYTVDIVVDEAMIAKILGPRALGNKNGFSRLAGGAISCKVTHERHVPKTVA